MLVLPCLARSAGSLRLNLSASHRFRRVQVFAPVSLRVPRYGDLEAESGRGVSGIGRFTAGGHRSTGMGGSSPFLSRSLRFVSRKLGLVAGWPRHRPLRRRWPADWISVRGFGWPPRSDPRLARAIVPLASFNGSRVPIVQYRGWEGACLSVPDCGLASAVVVKRCGNSWKVFGEHAS